ncbi:sarcoplasmic reticulum histidine-rich calcium-binding protein-like [Haliotis rufescens]|uniref:sarcoplasmic reticulum histidine-rich calcium-binding protein-like n=1 Tax=Haliotis rufescens TaxID=6454 RepID=UPI001EAFD041|nr:sarcoplasmic reticulum histidine-rich calcium-binding protein-like [Haliotis rufescens]
MKFVQVVIISIFVLIGLSLAAETSEDKKEAEVDEETLDYAKGSVCGYCTYCKFCKLCDADCPCEKSASKPNCKMCKYCKFCYLCSAMCDTVCKPGGVLDTVSAAIVNALPSVNKEEVQDDLDSVKPWIDRKDEL